MTKQELLTVVRKLVQQETQQLNATIQQLIMKVNQQELMIKQLSEQRQTSMLGNPMMNAQPQQPSVLNSNPMMNNEQTFVPQHSTLMMEQQINQFTNKDYRPTLKAMENSANTFRQSNNNNLPPLK